MDTKRLIKKLEDLPPDFSVELSAVMALDKAKSDGFEVILDMPIIGLAVSEATKEVRFVIDPGPHILSIGSVVRFKEVTKKEVTKEVGATLLDEQEVFDLEKLQEALEVASQDKADLFDFYNKHWNKLVKELEVTKARLAAKKD